MGFCPYYFKSIGRVRARRVLAHMLLERLHVPGQQLAPWAKHAVCLIGAKKADNDVLAAHFAFWAHKAGASVEQLEAVLDGATQGLDDDLVSAFALARTAASAPSRITADVVAQITGAHTPASVIELLLTISIGACLHRYTATYPPSSYEPIVAAFVAEHGERLALPMRPGPSA